MSGLAKIVCKESGFWSLQSESRRFSIHFTSLPESFPAQSSVGTDKTRESCSYLCVP